MENKTLILANGRVLAYAEYGKQSGKPLFFFHGWPSSRLQANVLDKAAKKLSIRVISPDRPGYGLSSFQENRKLLTWPDDVVKIAQSLHIHKFAVLGVSGGGPYAAACAYKIPEKITQAGIVVGLAPTDIKGVLQGMSFVNKLVWRSYHSFPFLMQVVASTHLAQALRIVPDIFSFTYRGKADRKLLSKNIKEDIARNRDEAFRQGKKATVLDLKIYTDNWGFNLKDIKAKVYLWYGENDKNVSLNMGKYYASQIKNSNLTIYPNEGHFLIRNHAEEILKELMG